uniref:ATCSLD5 n=1 Tax=Arundo donax TaxID=35708 RepID=A0A0A9CTL9_ARUDO
MIVTGGTIRKLHRTSYSSANASSSLSSAVPGLDVSVKEMSRPAITLSSPCSTAAGCALVPPMTQNCSLRHHSCSVIPDHLISSSASRQSVTVMTSRSARNVALSHCTMNLPEKRETAGSTQ